MSWQKVDGREDQPFTSEPVRRVDDRAWDIQISMVKGVDGFQFYSLALDESTDVSDTSQLAIFVRRVIKTFKVVEELLDLCPMTGTTTGQDIF